MDREETLAGSQAKRPFGVTALCIGNVLALGWLPLFALTDLVVTETTTLSAFDPPPLVILLAAPLYIALVYGAWRGSKSARTAMVLVTVLALLYYAFVSFGLAWFFVTAAVANPDYFLDLAPRAFGLGLFRFTWAIANLVYFFGARAQGYSVPLMEDRLARKTAPATLRNREPILEVLQRVLTHRGLLLEIASGTGEHAAFMTPRLGPDWTWQPSDIGEEKLADIDSYASESGCERIRSAILLNVMDEIWPVAHAEAVLCCNMIHIAPWEAAEGLVQGAERILTRDAPLILYGPFKRHGEHTASSNAEFDATLRRQNSLWGVRCLDQEVMPLARCYGFDLCEIVSMPANNFTVIFRKR